MDYNSLMKNSTLQAYGFYRVAVAVPEVRVGDVAFNVKETAKVWEEASKKGAAITLFPELGLSGYSCGDLFFQVALHEAVEAGLESLLALSGQLRGVAVVGLPLPLGGRLYNVAAVIGGGRLLGVVPKTFVPEHKEYYEKRWFVSGAEVTGRSIRLAGQEAPFGVDLLFEHGALCMGVEVCEDLWSVLPPSSRQAVAGANVLVNLSASDEMVGKSEYRQTLVAQQSARCLAAYLYASCGPGESTTDVVFGGDAMIFENGVLLARTERFVFESRYVTAEIDLQRLETARRSESGYADAPQSGSWRRITLPPLPAPKQLSRPIDPHPFVPSDPARRSERCREIFAIQTTALRKRLRHICTDRCVIGISGGLDSTLALLAVARAYEQAGLEKEKILCVTMPGFGTTGRTLNNAKTLCAQLGVSLREIDITPSCLQHFKDIGHDPEVHDVVFENVQARERTQILMDLANKAGGIVIGTGDLSELALGWSTYNGDHMSMYAINIGIPKTLVRYMVAWAAQEAYPRLRAVLEDILDTPVSPELLPHQEDEIVQKTEETVGPYELHDFFLYHFIKSGATPSKILLLAQIAFAGRYERAEIKKWLALFLRRFFSQQFKRSCLPDGPKVGTIALSPRGDWRMPSDAVVGVWLKELEEKA